MAEELIGQEFVQHCVRYRISGYRKPKSMEYYWSNYHQRVWQHQGGVFDKNFKAMILVPVDKRGPKRCGKFEGLQHEGGERVKVKYTGTAAPYMADKVERINNMLAKGNYWHSQDGDCLTFTCTETDFKFSLHGNLWEVEE